jgi:Fe-S cluster assembly protein SufB
MSQPDILNLDQDYTQKYGFHDDIQPVFQTERGLSRRVIEAISYHKNEPKWMREFRLQAYEIFMSKPMPTWGPDLSQLNFDEIVYYIQPTDRKGRSWDEVPEEIKRTFERLGIPEWERKFLAGVGAQYDSFTVYHNLAKQWEEKGVIFVDTDTAVREYPDLVTGILRHGHPAHRQQVRCAELGGVVGWLVRVCAPRRACGHPAASLLPHQRQERGSVRAHADYR